MTHLFLTQGDMDTSPSTPPGRGITSSHGVPPDAPRKPKQSRPPAQVCSSLDQQAAYRSNGLHLATSADVTCVDLRSFHQMPL